MVNGPETTAQASLLAKKDLLDSKPLKKRTLEFCHIEVKVKYEYLCTSLAEVDKLSSYYLWCPECMKSDNI